MGFFTYGQCLLVRGSRIKKAVNKKNKTISMYQLKLCVGGFSPNQVTSHGHVKIDLAFSKRNSWYTYLKQRSFLNDPTGEYFDGHFCGCESKGGCRFGCGICKPGCGG